MLKNRSQTISFKEVSFSLETYYKLYTHDKSVFCISVGYYITVLKQLKHQILGLTVSKAALNGKQNT